MRLGGSLSATYGDPAFDVTDPECSALLSEPGRPVGVASAGTMGAWTALRWPELRHVTLASDPGALSQSPLRPPSLPPDPRTVRAAFPWQNVLSSYFLTSTQLAPHSETPKARSRVAPVLRVS